jgi:hypothetical protein
MQHDRAGFLAGRDGLVEFRQVGLVDRKWRTENREQAVRVDPLTERFHGRRIVRLEARLHRSQPELMRVIDDVERVGLIEVAERAGSGREAHVTERGRGGLHGLRHDLRHGHPCRDGDGGCEDFASRHYGWRP